MKYRIGICDDEKIQVKVNAVYVKEIAKRNKLDIEVYGVDTVEGLYKIVGEKKLDILFLDIDMGSVSGITAAAALMEKYPEIVIIFLTGHREFAEEAFEVEAMGYIVKPIEEKKMERIFLKAIKQVWAQKAKEGSVSLVVTVDNLKRKIRQADILYIERQGAKSIIYTRDGEAGVYETITALYDRLEEEKFLRISQSDIVNRLFIQEIANGRVRLRNGLDFAIGRTYKKEVNEKYFGKN